jgi:hypothetical protein
MGSRVARDDVRTIQGRYFVPRKRHPNIWCLIASTRNVVIRSEAPLISCTHKTCHYKEPANQSVSIKKRPSHVKVVTVPIVEGED